MQKPFDGHNATDLFSRSTPTPQLAQLIEALFCQLTDEVNALQGELGFEAQINLPDGGLANDVPKLTDLVAGGLPIHQAAHRVFTAIASQTRASFTIQGFGDTAFAEIPESIENLLDASSPDRFTGGSIYDYAVGCIDKLSLALVEHGVSLDEQLESLAKTIRPAKDDRDSPIGFSHEDDRDGPIRFTR